MKIHALHPISIFDSFVARFKSYSTAKALILVFLAGFVVRLVPELIAYSSPIGYDKIRYAVVMKNDEVVGSRFVNNAATMKLDG